ncbi:TVP18/Calcium channel flower [Aspergillus oryzae]|uniref:TVP18/Calcium channel flower n=1 Tax=Aspergillus oryzae TaxID=5062 RepID=A0A1S9DMN1_ASPOZ|nr:TVP18/Calcium channel flower [Aspergillus oryzae]
MTFAEEFRSRNFSIYGQWFVTFFDFSSVPYRPSVDFAPFAKRNPRKQWLPGPSNGCAWHLTGVVCIVLCIALGIANIFSFNAVRIVFSILCLVSGFVLVFIEVPFLLRICPTSEKFDTFIRRFTTNWMRAAMYVVMSALQWVSLVSGASSLIAAAVLLLLAGLFYALAGLKSQEFVGSKTLGGQGLAQMIV